MPGHINIRVLAPKGCPFLTMHRIVNAGALVVMRRIDTHLSGGKYQRKFRSPFHHWDLRHVDGFQIGRELSVHELVIPV